MTSTLTTPSKETMGYLPARTIRQAYDHTLAHGGGTFETMGLGDLDVARSAWAVGGSRDQATRIIPINYPAPAQLFAEAYLDFLYAYVPFTMTRVDDGQLYVAAVDVIENTDAAIQLAYARGEKAIYNLYTQRTLEVS